MTDSPTCKVCHRPTGDTSWLCTEDTNRLETMLAELPALLADIATTTARQDRISPSSSPRRRPVELDPDPATEPHTKDRPDLGVKVQALPVHVDAAVLGRRITDELGTWVRHLAESRGRSVDAQPTSLSLVSWLLRHLSSVRLDEACGELYRDVRRWTAQGNAMTSGREDRVYVGQCRAHADDWCCSRELWSPIGADEIICDGWGTTDGDGCFAVHTAGDRHALLRREFEHAAVSWDEAVQALPGLFPGEMPRSAMLRAWKSRGERAGSGADPRALLDDGGDVVTRHGEPLWRGGDVLAAVERWRLLNRTGAVRRGRRRVA